MSPEVQELISAMSAEIAILRTIADHPDPSLIPLDRFERARLAKERTQKAAIACGVNPE